MPDSAPPSTEHSRLLVTGASGQLGGYLLRMLAETGRALTAWSGGTVGQRCGYPLQPVDLTSPGSVQQAFTQAAPHTIIHAAALSRIDQCFQNPRRAEQINAEATKQLADLAAQTGARLLYVSTDLVFDGEQGNYSEVDVPRPLSRYGQTKRAGEEYVLARPEAVVVRVSLLYGPSLTGRPNFFDQQRAALLAGQPCTLFTDEWRTPLGYADAARALLAIADSSITGCLHVGGPERMSRYEMGERLAAQLGVPASRLTARSRLAAAGDEPRPADVSLNSARFHALFPDVQFHTLAR